MLLHYDLPGPGSVLGLEFVDHLLTAPEHLVDEILRNPRWRHATAEEEAAHAPAADPAESGPAKPKAEPTSATSKPAARTRTRKAGTS